MSNDNLPATLVQFITLYCFEWQNNDQNNVVNQSSTSEPILTYCSGLLFITYS